MSVIGIDIGSENCHIATIRQGGVEVLDDVTGSRLIPAYVGFGEKTRQIGSVAKSQHIMNVNNTIFGCKRLIGRTVYDPFGKNELSYLPYHVCPLADEYYGVKVVFRHEEAVFSIQQIVAMLLGKLKEIAKRSLGEISNCVISVPAYFHDSSRRALLDAARIAGLNVLRLINDTSAVALSYGFYKQDLSDTRPITVVFLDIGHTTLQITACSMIRGKFNVLATETDSQLGGRDFNNAMVRHFAKEFHEKYKLDVLSNTRATVRLFYECARLKKMLSANPKTLPLSIECFMEDKDVVSHLDRSQFEKLCGDLLRRAENIMRHLLNTANLKPSDIYAVELVGGTSRIPAIKTIVQNVFGIEPSTTLNQDEATCRGCALQCGILSPALTIRDYSFLDVQQFPIKLLWSISSGEKGEIEIFHRNHQVPHSKYLTFYQKEPFTLNVYYGLVQYKPTKEEFIGSFFIDNVNKSPSGESFEIRIKIRIDINGIFNVRSAIMLNKEDNTGTLPDQNLENEMDITGKIIETDVIDRSQETERGLGFFYKKKKTTKPIELPIIVNVMQLTDDGLLRLIECERKLQEVDRAESDRVDNKNNLEAYIYEMKDMLGTNAAKFLDEQELKNFKNRLDHLQTWLYDEGENQSKQVFIKTLKELKDIGDPVLLRQSEFEARQDVINSFHASLKWGQKILETHLNELSAENISKIQSILKTRLEWIQNKVQLLIDNPLHKNPPVLCKEIIFEKESFEKELNKIMGVTSLKQDSGQSGRRDSGTSTTVKL